MTEQTGPNRPKDRAPTDAERRRERQAAALRENLRRRKTKLRTGPETHEAKEPDRS